MLVKSSFEALLGIARLGWAGEGGRVVTQRNIFLIVCVYRLGWRHHSHAWHVTCHVSRVTIGAVSLLRPHPPTLYLFTYPDEFLGYILDNDFPITQRAASELRLSTYG